ncbi:hypothetical protein [Bacillus pumilus]|uniref:hypothetical protein n=1 Tax=Bacillus pumilus TaxID=1408 RepID=UPI0011A6F414|nr:hypothetical protein [Bacillus pumilus]
MNLTLREWNESCQYASNAVEILKKEKHNIRIKMYTMYNGDKGLGFQVLDDAGNFFAEYLTGITESLSEMKESIDKQVRRIAKECI